MNYDLFLHTDRVSKWNQANYWNVNVFFFPVVTTGVLIFILILKLWIAPLPDWQNLEIYEQGIKIESRNPQNSRFFNKDQIATTDVSIHRRHESHPSNIHHLVILGITGSGGPLKVRRYALKLNIFLENQKKPFFLVKSSKARKER